MKDPKTYKDISKKSNFSKNATCITQSIKERIRTKFQDLSSNLDKK